MKLKVFYSNQQSNKGRKDICDEVFIFPGKNECKKISRNKLIVVEELSCEHKEADTKLVALAAKPGSTVMIRSSS